MHSPTSGGALPSVHLALLQSLGELSVHESPSIRPTAVRMLVECAIKPQNLVKLLDSIAQEENKEERIKASMVLHTITQHEVTRSHLIGVNAPSILSKVLMTESDEMILKQVLLSLFELIAYNSNLQIELVTDYYLCDALQRILAIALCRDLMNWVILIAHHLVMSDEINQYLIEKDIIRFFGAGLRQTYGNWALQKICFNALVTLIDPLSNSDAQSVLASLDKYNILALISTATKIDDEKLVYWSLYLLHNFCAKDVFRDRIRIDANLSRAMFLALGHSDSSIVKLVLRSLKFLCIKDTAFQLSMVKNGFITQIMNLVSTRNDDLQYWGLTLLHELAPHQDALVEIIRSKQAERLFGLAGVSTHSMIPLYVLDIFYYICHSHMVTVPDIEHADLCSHAVSYVTIFDKELATTTLACLSNLALRGSEIVGMLYDYGIVPVIASSLNNPDRKTSDVLVAKVFSIMVASKPEIAAEVVDTALVPYVLGDLIEYSCAVKFASKIIEVEDPESRSEQFEEWLESLGRMDSEVRKILSGSDSKTNGNATINERVIRTKLNGIAKDGVFTRLLARLENSISTVKLFFMSADIVSALMYSNMPLMKALYECILDSIMIFKISPLALIRSQIQDEIGLNSERSAKQKQDITNSALLLGASLCNFSDIKEILLTSGILDAMVEYNMSKTETAHTSVLALSWCVQNILSVDLLAVKNILPALLQSLKNDPETRSYICAESSLCRIIDDSAGNLGDYQGEGMNPLDCSPHLLVSRDLKKIWNPFWSFESIRGTTAVSNFGKFAYEVTILSEGLVQMGWATERCVFDYINGRGIGDCGQSYSFDGVRQKKWHGSYVHYDGDDYGKTCYTGDVVGCLIDLDEGQIAFYINGESQGVAFTDIEKSGLWYPAVSVAADQGCQVSLGGPKTPLRHDYTHKGFISVFDSIAQTSKFLTDKSESPKSAESSGFISATSSPLNLSNSYTKREEVQQPICYFRPCEIASNQLFCGFELLFYCELETLGISGDINRSCLLCGWETPRGDFLSFSAYDGILNWRTSDFLSNTQDSSKRNDLPIETQIMKINESYVRENWDEVPHLIIGLGVLCDSQSNSTRHFFTINGKYVACVESQRDFATFDPRRPTVKNGQVLGVNFGQKKFAFDIECDLDLQANFLAQ